MTSIIKKLNIRCKLINTGRIDSIWNKSLDGLEGFITSIDTTGWGGYSVEVKLDNPPDWISDGVARCVYIQENKGRNIIGELSDKEFNKFKNYVAGILTFFENVSISEDFLSLDKDVVYTKVSNNEGILKNSGIICDFSPQSIVRKF